MTVRGSGFSAIPEFVAVRVVSNRFASEGVARGTVGYVVVVHDAEHYEVEVSNPATGETVAMITAGREDLELGP